MIIYINNLEKRLKQTEEILEEYKVLVSKYEHITEGLLEACRLSKEVQYEALSFHKPATR